MQTKLTLHLDKERDFETSKMMACMRPGGSRVLIQLPRVTVAILQTDRCGFIHRLSLLH